MGSRLYLGMPRTGGYTKVISLLGNSAGGGGAKGVDPGTLADVADATLTAAIAGLQLARIDVGLTYCVYLLTRTVRAAREPNLLVALDEAGLPTPWEISGLPDVPMVLNPTELTVFDLTCGYTTAVDRELRRAGGRTDISEMAQLGAAAESLSVLSISNANDSTGSLWDDKRITVLQGLKALSSDQGFGRLACDFFARFVRRFLEYHLCRELSNHVGPGRRFANVDAHDEFLVQLDEHCHHSASVVRPFAAQWYAKRNRQADLDLGQAKGFASRALGLLRGAVAHQEGRHVEN